VNRGSSRSLSGSIALGAVLLAASALAQSFGEQDQTLRISGLDFQDEMNPDGGVVGDDGYVYNQLPDVRNFIAPFTLPSGSGIELMCIDYYDPSSIPVVAVYLEMIKLAAGGQGPEPAVIPHAYTTSVLAGYGRICTDPLSFTVRDSKDINDDGNVYPVAYAARVGLFTGSAVGALEVTWKRQIRPSPAAPTFADVPGSDGAFQHIEALAASSITSGCGGGNYCPDATLTRRQMAVFLAKALGLHWSE
jgi:hypothetical protein